MSKMNSELAPILLFVYKRLDTLKLNLEALKKNDLARESDLIIFSDAAKHDHEKTVVEEVREYLCTISGFRSVTIHKSQINKGLANSIIDGVTQIINEYGKVIVLEDDLETSSNFLLFMNQSLKFYESYPDIISVSGYNMAITPHKNYPYDVFFTLRSASWGWGTWKKKWIGIDWEVSDFRTFSGNKKDIKAFNDMGSDLFGMLKKQQMKLNNSWAIRYCYHQFKYNLYSVYPTISKVRNIGFDENATHTIQKYNRFDVLVDRTEKTKFKFSTEVILDEYILKQFRSLNGIRKRLISKIRNSF